MGEDKIQELLLQLVQDMSFLKAKLSNIEEQKLSSRIDNLEAQNREHERTIRSLEKRNDTMEEFSELRAQANKLGVSITIHKIKGHSGNTFNELVDKLAKEESMKAKENKGR